VVVGGFEQTLAAALKKGDAVQEGAKLRAQIMAIAKKRVKLVSEAVVRPSRPSSLICMLTGLLVL
jgi:hypothetical protein